MKNPLSANRIFRYAWIWVWLLPLSVQAGNDEQPAGARRMGLGGAFVAVNGDFWGLFANPAGISGMTNAAAGIYMERRFMLSELNNGSFGFVLPFQQKHFAAIDGGGFGYKGYNESRIGLTYATTIAEKFSLGVKVNYSRTSIENYGSAGAVHIDVGFHTQVTKSLSAGFRVYNANQAYLDRPAGEKLPTLFTLGTAWKVNSKTLVVADVEKNVQYPLSFRSGIEYAFLPNFKARVGVATAPFSLNAGIGLQVKKLAIDFASSYHEILGYSPHLSLTWKFGKEK